MKSTIESFWLMMINNNSSLIVTLSDFKEDGRVIFLLIYKKIIKIILLYNYKRDQIKFLYII